MKVRNVQKMKYDIKGTVNMKLQLEETFNLNGVLYVPQTVKNILRVPRLIPKGTTMGNTKDKITTKKNGISMNLNAREQKTRAQCSA